MTKRTRRVIADCRKMPSEKHCTVTIAGKASEVLPVAVFHAVKHHGHKNTPALRRQVKTMLRPVR